MLDNPWFVGIVGGILSDVAATWVSRFIFSKRDSREYAQKVAAVNREVIYSMRPGISEGSIPESSVFKALVAATCRKYGVSEGDVFTVFQISEELIKEVMDSSFISSSIKQDYCAKLMQMREPHVASPGAPLMVELRNDEASIDSIEKVRSKMLAQMSAMMGFMVTILSFTLTVFKDRPGTGIFGSLKDLFSPFVVLAASVVAMMAVMLMTIVVRQTKRVTTKAVVADNASAERKDG